MALMHPSVAPVTTRRRPSRVYWPAILWSAAAGGAGGLLGWVLGEFVNTGQGGGNVYLDALTYFLVVSASIGAVLGALPGLRNRSLRQAACGAAIGALVGGVGGGLGGLPAQFAYNALGDGLLARAVGWAIVGGAIGLCPGAATRDKGRAWRGIAGGLAGGFLGGLLFNLVALSPADTGTASRFAADLVVGALVGALVAAVESALKKAWLTVISGRREGAQFILSKAATTIGRDDRDDVILWGDPQLATSHAQVRCERGRYLLEPAQAGGPVLVNGRVAGGPTSLHDGDEIVLGITRLRFHARGAPPAPAVGPTVARMHPDLATPYQPRDPLPVPPVEAMTPLAADPAAVLPALEEARAGDLCLVGADGPTGAHNLAATGTLTIGRAADNDIVLADPSVSSRHAELIQDGGRWVVRDLGSTNGTFVSYDGSPRTERRVERNALKVGSTVRFGEALYRLERVPARV